ncbi:hypothetical protein HYV43_05190 [Candidatus Micrarchaeota archaeon]|nr:hypothetical protein [Candidatus Micrarchaeota archaeon]
MEKILPPHYRPLIEDLERHGIDYTPIHEDVQFGPHLLINTAGENRGKILAMLNARIDAQVRAEQTPQAQTGTRPGFWARLFRKGEESPAQKEKDTGITREMREPHMTRTYDTLEIMEKKGGVGTGDLARSALEDWARAHAINAFVDATPVRTKKTERKVAIRIIPRNGPS